MLKVGLFLIKQIKRSTSGQMNKNVKGGGDHSIVKLSDN